MAKPSNINFKIDLSVNGQKQAVDLGMSLDDLGAAIAKINKASQSCHQRLGNFAMGVAGIMASINGLNDAVASLTSSYLSFDSAMKRVNTMAGLSKEGFDNIKDSVSELSQSIPLAREQLADGLYQVISNGVPKDNWIEFLNTSARSAVGGIADLGQTVTVTSTIIKNYALDWSAAQEIQDKMQLTAKNGVTSFEQLAAALPRVAGNAATLGVSIDELMAVFATLTGVSGNTAEVSTQLAAVFTSLVKPSSEAAKMAAEMGIQFNAASINAKGGFEAFLTSLQQAVKTYAESSGQLEQEIYGKLFGSAEALRALGALTGPLADKFRENIGAMADSTGTMDQAFDEMNSTAEAGMQKMKNYIASITDTAASLLSKSQPILGFVSSVALIPQGFGVLIKSFKALGGAASSMLTSAFTKLRGPLLGLAIQAQLSSGAVKGLLTALKGFGAIGLVIAAVTAVVVAFSQHAQAADKAAQSAEILRRTTEKLKESNENVADSVGRIRVELNTEAAKLRKLIDAKQDTTAAVEELNKKYGEELGCQKTAVQWLEVLTTKSQAYARAKALEAESISLAAEEYAISERKRLNQETQDKLRKEGRDKTRHVTGNLATMGSAAGANMGAGGAVVETVSKEMQAALEEAATINADAAANAEARQRVADRLAEASTDLAAGLAPEIVADPGVTPLVEATAAVLDAPLGSTSMSVGMIDALRRSNYVFSGLKTFHSLNEAFPSMVGGDGVLKPFKQFLNDVKSIDSTYNKHYLRAEYNFAIASAQSAARWEQIEADGDRYDLQYRTAGDNKVRPEHAALHGVTLPPSSPFWDSFMPPNGWNCRCTAVQVRRGKYPQTDIAEAMERGETATADDKRGMMRFNPGKERSVWPAYNPYTTTRCRDCDIARGKSSFTRATPPENDVCAACWMTRECENRNKEVKKPRIPAEKKDAILARPYDEQFDVVYEGKRGRVFRHLLHCAGAIDHNRVEDAAKAFADNVGDCWINPEVHHDSPMRHVFYHDLPTDARCNPDLRVKGIGYVDIKSPEKESCCCRNAIHASKQQHSCACITNHQTSITMRNILKRNAQIWNDSNYASDNIFWLIGDRLLKFGRP